MAGTGRGGKHMTCEPRGRNGPLPACLEKESCYFIKQGAHHVCVNKNIFIKILISKFQQSTLKAATQNEDPEQRPLDLVGKLTQLSQGFSDGGSLFLTFLSMYHPGEFLTRMDCLQGEKTLSSLGNHISSGQSHALVHGLALVKYYNSKAKQKTSSDMDT